MRNKSGGRQVIGTHAWVPYSTPDRTDGLGNPLVDAAEYYIQDSRTYVGNCAIWWEIASQGYTCDLNKAGIYAGRQAAKMRQTDVPWPVEHVRAAQVTHVRVDGPALDRSRYKPGPR
jgi:hypothetical protein